MSSSNSRLLATEDFSHISVEGCSLSLKHTALSASCELSVPCQGEAEVQLVVCVCEKPKEPLKPKGTSLKGRKVNTCMCLST